MKALIVDDEPLALSELRQLLRPFTGIHVVGEARDIDEARQRIETLSPDVVFLDIQMPGGSGFDLLLRLDHLPHIIFTTAYDHYAVKAFEVNALDYLLKPIEPQRLAAALGKLAAPAPHSRHNESDPSFLEQLFVRDGARYWFVPLREVSLFSAEGNYVRMQWGKERPVLARSLAMLEDRLDTRRFFRINRQQIVNLELIKLVEPLTGGRLHVQMRDGTRLEISRRQAHLLRARTRV